MLREGPRVVSAACEVADWSHVEVYLTRSVDHRMLLITGSTWEAELCRWIAARETVLTCIGSPPSSDPDLARVVVRFQGDHDHLVSLLATGVAVDLLAAHWWSNGPYALG